jgi:ubiquinone/menaquinone biosynthesis C-methylase UbiE
MLDRARRKLVAEGVTERVSLVRQDMRDLDLEGRFNLAFAAINSFMHLLTTDDQLEALARARRHLNPGGLLLLDLFNPDLGRLLDYQGQMRLDKTMTDPETGHRLMRFATQTVDEVDGQGGVQRTLFPFSMRYLFRWELELLLRHAGFVVEAVYGSYDLDEFSADSDKMIAVAMRPD